MRFAISMELVAGVISAVVLAAGLSTRMGRPKLVLRWGETTIIGQVIRTLEQAGVDEVVVVTGGARELVEAAVAEAAGAAVRMVFNPRYAEEDMLISLREGMHLLGDDVQAMLVVLGDQPQIDASVIRALLDAYRSGQSRLWVPSFQNRRGHPWLVDRALWSDLFFTPANFTMRDFLNAHGEDLAYLTVNSPAILRDMDTLEDYERDLPKKPDM